MTVLPVMKSPSVTPSLSKFSRLFIVGQKYHPEEREICDLLKMTGFFLRKNFFQTHGLKFPENRASLLSNLGLTSY